MADLTRRPANRPSRRQREQRAYRLAMAGGAAGALAVITGLLAIVGVLGWGLPVIAAIVAIACLLIFRSAVGR
jgi:hypothetical protein